ncbi:flagellar hook-associated protein 3, partial [Aeromonas veronii]
DVPIAKGVSVSLNEGADTLFLSGGGFFKELDDFVTLLESGASDVSTEAGAMLDRSMGVLDNIASMTSRIGAKINLLD